MSRCATDGSVKAYCCIPKPYTHFFSPYSSTEGCCPMPGDRHGCSGCTYLPCVCGTYVGSHHPAVQQVKTVEFIYCCLLLCLLQVISMIKSSALCGSAIIAYLQAKGYPEVCYTQLNVLRKFWQEHALNDRVIVALHFHTVSFERQTRMAYSKLRHMLRA